MSASARDGTGENSSENWTSPEFFSPIFSLGPSRIRRCIVLPEQTKTRIIRTLIWNELTYKSDAFRAILVLMSSFKLQHQQCPFGESSYELIIESMYHSQNGDG